MRLQSKGPEALDALTLESAAATGAKVTDAEGTEWTVAHVDRWADSDLDDAPKPAQAQPATDSEANLSDYDLAMKLRRVRLVGDWEFIEVNPRVDAIAKARALDRAGVRGRTSPSAPGKMEQFTGSVAPPTDALPVKLAASPYESARSPAPFVLMFDEAITSNRRPSATWPFAHDRAYDQPLAPAFYQAPEDRSWVSSNWGWPHGSAVRLTAAPFGTPGANCSAALIGRRTMTTAAHCIWNRNAGAYYSQRSWAVDFVDKWVNWGTSRITQSVYGPVNFCYSVEVPYDYRTGGGAPPPQYDYAVMEAYCGHNPGDTTGFVNAGIGAPSDYEFPAAYIEGYDLEDPLPPFAVGSTTYVRGSLLTRYAGQGSGTSRVRGSTAIPELLETKFDATAAASGSGVLMNLFRNVGDTSFYWGGILTSDQLAYVYARRSDWIMWSFVSEGTSEWP